MFVDVFKNIICKFQIFHLATLKVDFKSKMFRENFCKFKKILQKVTRTYAQKHKNVLKCKH